MASVWVAPLGQTPGYLDPQSHEALHEVDVIGMALHFSFGQRPGGGHRELEMTNYPYLIIDGAMTPAAAVDGIRTPAAIVREIKKRLGLSRRTCKGQAAIDRDVAAVISVPTKVGYE